MVADAVIISFHDHVSLFFSFCFIPNSILNSPKYKSYMCGDHSSIILITNARNYEFDFLVKR